MHEVEFIDGQVKEYGANIIAENMLTQVDSNRYRLMLMEGIVDTEKMNLWLSAWRTSTSSPTQANDG